MGRRRLGRVGWLGVVAVLASCAPGTVRVRLAPAVGTTAAYRIAVRAEAVTRIEGHEPRRRVEDTVLEARHRVVSAGPDGTLVEVRLRSDGVADSVFEIRLDRAGQPVEVQRIEGIPAGALGDLGLPEILPGVVAAPPDRPLEPGDRWTIDEPVALTTPEAARAEGEGRLVRLERADGRRVAHVASEYRLPVRRTADDTGGRLLLDGSLDTRAQVAYDLDDDVVASVRARTSGRYRVTLLPPAGLAGTPVPGTLVVQVEATTRRLP